MCLIENEIETYTKNTQDIQKCIDNRCHHFSRLILKSSSMNDEQTVKLLTLASGIDIVRLLPVNSPKRTHVSLNKNIMIDLLTILHGELSHNPRETY